MLKGFNGSGQQRQVGKSTSRTPGKVLNLSLTQSPLATLTSHRNQGYQEGKTQRSSVEKGRPASTLTTQGFAVPDIHTL